MNEIDLVTELRAEVRAPDDDRLAAGRTRFLSAAGVTGPARVTRPHAFRPRVSFPGYRSRSFLIPALSAAAAIAVTAGAIGYGVSAGGGSGGGSGSAAKHAVAANPVAPGRATLAARILNRAADVTGSAPATATPAPKQWIYLKSIETDYTRPSTVAPEEIWVTYDGTEVAFAQGGKIEKLPPNHGLLDQAGLGWRFVTRLPGTNVSGKNPLAAFNADVSPRTACLALASLPSDPKSLLAMIEKERLLINYGAYGIEWDNGYPVYATSPSLTKFEDDFEYLSWILVNTAGGVGTPPKGVAAVFRAMATLPGITVQQGTKDAAGAPAIGVSADAGIHQILLDPHTYQLIGFRDNGHQLVGSPNGATKAKNQELLAAGYKGIAKYDFARVTSREVSGPGQR